MKTNILKLSLITCLSSAAIIGCSTPHEKVEDAKVNVTDANNNLEQAKLDSVNIAAEQAQYRIEKQAILDANDQKIAELKKEVKTENKQIREKYEKSINALEEQNEAMKAKMKDYKETTKDKWQDFKDGFNKDIDELGKSISALSKKSPKK
jgi:DNA anti-recombination protein RmuC